MSFFGCRYKNSCEHYQRFGQVCNSFFEADQLRCGCFRVRENKEAVFSGKRSG